LNFQRYFLDWSEIIVATDRSRFTISVDPKMFEDIENFRFIKRYPTRSEATAELIRLGLEALRQLDADPSRNVPVTRNINEVNLP
jgi:hypothetical protein